MFLENTWRYMRGYICIKVEGYFVERFLNLCMLKNIELWNIKKKNEIERQQYGNTLGSVSFVPSVGGLVIASEVVKDIIS